jgi:YaiO family outer membrane protein
MHPIKGLGKVIRFLSVIILSLTALTVNSQNVTFRDTLSLEALFAKARDYAYNNRKVESREICRQILIRDSTYWDVAVLLGRTYAWDKRYDSARIVLSKVISHRPGYYDAVDALIDVEYWSDNYLDAIKYADMGLSFHPNDDTFRFKKAKALNSSGNTQKALEIIDLILLTNPSNKDAIGLQISIRRSKMVNKLTVNYWTDIFKDDSPWKFASAAIGRKTQKFGTVTLRYNYARRFGNDGHQIEVDAYPAIVKGVYMYFSTAFSNKKNFPYSRLSMEPYFKLPSGFEMSAGFRYLNFDDNRIAAFDSNKVVIYTGSIGKYYGNYWFSLRPYLTPGKDKWSKSVNLTVRHYMSDPESYLSLVIGTGISPDEQQYAFDPGYYLKSNKISLEYQQKIASRIILDCRTGFAREEIRAGTRRNRYSFDIGASYLF